MTDATYNAWRLVSLSPWPGWVLSLVAAGAIAAVLLALRGLKGEPSRARLVALVALRSASALLALFLVVEPALQLLQTARVKSRLAVLVDSSRSMSFPADSSGDSRAAAVSAWIVAHRRELQSLQERVHLEWYTFDKSVSPVDPGLLAGGVPASGSRTDIMAALESASSGGAAGVRRLAGALVLSDGTDNGMLAEGLSQASRANLAALGVPITAVAVGSVVPKDLAVERIAVDDFAFVRNTVTIEVTLAAHGFGREQIQVALRREGAIVASSAVQLQPGKEHYSVPLSFAPDSTGTFVFTVAAPVLAGEALAENNSRSFVLHVIRDRVRVLLVAGRPSWDVRFLRGILKQDPNVDLISFFILRTGGDSAGPQSELSLIPFPVAEILGEQLRTFDAVFFINFAYQPYRSLDIERHLPNLRDYVMKGGALAMVGGEQSFGEGRYGETPLKDILPVEASSSLKTSAGEFRPRLTPEGRRHPVTSLVVGEGPNDAAWGALPPIPGLNLTLPLAPDTGARVLVEAPTQLVQGLPAPVVAVRDVGAGRTLVVTTDSSWFWGFVAAEEGHGNRAYQRFWNNSLRWLVRDPELTQLKVKPDSRTVEPGEPVGVTLFAQTPDYGPAAGAAVSAELLSEDGNVVARGQAIAGADGTARVELLPPGPGAYKIAAASERQGQPIERAISAVAVRTSGPEDADVAPRPDLLRALAQATGGSFAALSDGSMPEVNLRESEVVEIGKRKDVPIWDRWWILLSLSVILAAEWLLRRRWGYW